MQEKLSLVIPTYNERKNIESLVKHLEEIFAKENILFQIIIVDDDSPDGTWQAAEDLIAKNKNIKLIRRIKQKGLATAVVAGWDKAGGEILGVIDGDFQHPPEIIPLMLNKMLEDNSVDIVIASRNVAGGGVSKWSLWRRSISWFATAISSSLLPRTLKKIKDPMSGYFILRRKVIEGKVLTPSGYKILLEVLAKGNYKKVIEIPYIFQERKRGGSKVDIKQYLTSLKYVWRLSIQTKEIYGVLVRGIIFLLAILISWIFFVIRLKR